MSKTQYQIQYTSDSEGITIGVIGDDWMSCLLALTDEFGDGALPLYEKTREEMADLFRAVEETFEEEIKSAKKQQAAQQRTALEEPQPELDEAHTGSRPAEDGEDDDEGVGTHEEVALPDPDDQYLCTICAAEITKDLAQATEMMHGEPRCNDCKP